MTVNIIFYAVMSALSGLAPSFTWFLVLRGLFGIGMGGQWGMGASLVLETVPARWRGVLSGLLHQGYSLGNLLAALAFLVLYPAMQRFDPANAWRYMFFLGGLPALLSVFVLARSRSPRPGTSIEPTGEPTCGPCRRRGGASCTWCCS